MLIKNAIDKTLNKETARFFMPGHKGILSHYDVTELDGTDNLHFPSGAINEAQKTVSQIMGSKKSFFSVNGSSAALHAAIMSTCKRGDTLIVDRGCHISVINALIINDINPYFIYPEQNEIFGVSNGITANDVQKAIINNSDAKAVLITSPTYYGIVSDIKSIAEVTKKHKILLIVDEAHGAHFCFNDNLPKSALPCSADFVVQSAHKTLCCLTQGAILHVGTDKIDTDKVQRNLNMLQTTSPSYLIMSSIESAVLHMNENGKSRIDNLICQCDNLRTVLNETGKFKCLDKGKHVFDYDKTRLVINSNKYLQGILQHKYNVIPEMDDGFNLVCIPTVYNKPNDFLMLKKALLEIAKNLPYYNPIAHKPLPKPKMVMSPYEAYNSATENIDVNSAIGRVSAQSVYKSPPCMPTLCAGEVITEEIAKNISKSVISVVK